MSQLENRKVLILSTDEDFSDFKIDLGNITPAQAFAMLTSARNQLEELLPSPIITSYEQIIYDPYEQWILDDGDDV